MVISIGMFGLVARAVLVEVRTDGESERNREVNLGCVFTQTVTDDEARPMRNDIRTTYTRDIETYDEFGRRLYSEAWHR